MTKSLFLYNTCEKDIISFLNKNVSSVALKRVNSIKKFHVPSVSKNKIKIQRAYREERQISSFNTNIENFLKQEIWSVSTQERISIEELFVENQRLVFVFARSMGCVFCQELARQLKRDIIPYLSNNSNLYLISIGTAERGLEFSELTGFPKENLLADPENSLYNIVEFKNGIQETFFDIRTPLSIFSRAFKKDNGFDLLEATLKWKPWLPPKSNQALQQGGVLFFDGYNCKDIYVDESTGNHIDLNKLHNYLIDIDDGLRVNGQITDL